MKIVRLRMHRGQKAITGAQAIQYTKNLVSVLLGNRVPQRSKDPIGVSAVLESFSFGMSGNIIEEWTEEICVTLSLYPRKHLCTLPHYIMRLQHDETFGDCARFCASRLLEHMGFNSNQAIVVRHASEPNCPEHLHIIACRIVPNTLGLIQEASGWHQRAMAQLCPILEADLSLSPEPGAVFFYDSVANRVVRKKHEMKARIRLKENSRAFELQNGIKSPERCAKERAELVVKTLELGLKQGRQLTWDALHLICAKCGLLYELRHGVGFVSPDGETWFNAGQISKQLGVRHIPCQIEEPFLPAQQETLSHFKKNPLINL